MDDFARRLAALMEERGLGVRALARRVPCDAGYISRLRNDKVSPSAKVARRLDEVLGAGGELAASAVLTVDSAFTPDDPDDAGRLAFAARYPSRLDGRAIGSLAAVLATQRELEDRVGSAPMLTPVAAQATTAETLVKDAPAPLRTRLLDVTAQYCYFHGWLNESTGRLNRAVTLYDRALGQAVEAGDADLISELMSMKGHIAWARGDVPEAVRLSQAAQRDPGVHPGQHAISAMQEARALAVLGDASGANRRLTDAGNALARAEEHDGERPPWLYYHSPAFFAVQRGRVWLHLGAHDSRWTRAAVTALTAGVAGLDETARQSEWGASYLLYLASAHMEAGDLEHACMAAGEAAVAAQRLASASLLRSARRLHSRMAARWGADDGRIAALAEALR